MWEKDRNSKIEKNSWSVMIKGIQKISLIDFPGKISCTIFLGGCSFRWGYCYNSGLVLNPASLAEYLEKDLGQSMKT